MTHISDTGPPLFCAPQNWTWTTAQQSRIYVVEMSYIRGACGVSGWDRECNHSMNERFDMGVTEKRVDWGVVK